MPSVGSPPDAKLVELDFLGAPDLPVLGPPLCVLGPGGSIVDMLQDRQKDLDGGNTEGEPAAEEPVWGAASDEPGDGAGMRASCPRDGEGHGRG